MHTATVKLKVGWNIKDPLSLCEHREMTILFALARPVFPPHLVRIHQLQGAELVPQNFIFPSHS